MRKVWPYPCLRSSLSRRGASGMILPHLPVGVKAFVLCERPIYRLSEGEEAVAGFFLGR